MSKDKEFKYDVLAEIGDVEEKSSSTVKVKVISWNGAEPKLDSRPWFEDGKMGKGISISLESVPKLVELLNEVESDYESPTDSIEM